MSDSKFLEEEKPCPGVKGAVEDKEIYKKLYPEVLRMRDLPTKAEKLLWSELKNKKLGVKFRRQYIIDKYIVDFYCVENGLVIEVDGEIHNEQKERDAERDMVLMSLGCKVLRFSNEQVITDLIVVLNDIRSKIL